MWFRSRLTSATASSPPSSRKAKKCRSRRPAERLRLESLESRCLLTFIAPVSYASGNANYLAGSLAAGDFANNGIQDLVVGGQNGTVNVLMGNGDGTFKPAQSVATGGGAVSVAVGDLTGDGKLDIVAGNTGVPGHWYYVGYNGYYVPPVPGSVSVLMGNGDGTFQAPLSFTLPNEQVPGTNVMASQYPVSVALGDMNHDGHLDLVVAANYGEDVSSYVDVLLGHGDGSFTMASATAIPTVSRHTTISLDDFNRDGSVDVAVPVTNGRVAVLRGDGDGTLAAPTYVSTGGTTTLDESLAVGDVNGDGTLDLISANYDGAYGTSGSVSVLLGNGDGSFQPPIVSALPGYSPPGYSGANPLPLQQHPYAVVAGDLNHNGKLDLAVTSMSNYQQYTGTSGYYGKYYNTIKDNNITVLLGNGDGTFTDAQTVPLFSYDQSTQGGAMIPSAIIAGNFNGDSFSDLTVADGGQNAVSVLLNGANWSTIPQANALAISGFPSTTTAGMSGSFTVTALNADGTVDTSYTGTVRFSSSDGQAVLPAAYTFATADAGVHTFNTTLKTAGTQSVTATDTSSVTLAASETGITVTPAAASKLDISVPASSTAGSAFSITVTALDPYNNTVTDYAGTVHFTSSDGLAGLPADYMFTANDAGVHTFTSAVTLKTAGSQTVAATDASTSAIMGSTTVSVSPATACTMMVTGFPLPITAGTSGSFTVTLKDAYGNVATGYTGMVHFTSSDAKAVLPANYAFTSADAGKHTFSATLKTAGTQSIAATDTVNASLHGTDSGITVKAAAASKFVLSAPASVLPGVPFSLTVTVEDAYGNIVTDYTGTIHFASSDSKAHLPANYTFTAGNNGVHTFTGLVLRRTGNQTITVTDTRNSSISGKTALDVL